MPYQEGRGHDFSEDEDVKLERQNLLRNELEQLKKDLSISEEQVEELVPRSEIDTLRKANRFDEVLKLRVEALRKEKEKRQDKK